MKDFVKLGTTDVSSAVSPATAAVFLTLQPGDQIKSINLDNQFSVDMVVMVDQSKPVYLKTTAAKFIPLAANNAALSSPTSSVTLSIYAAGGVAPMTGAFIADCMF